MLAHMSPESCYAVPPLSELVALARQALVHECLPPVPDLAGSICLLNCRVHMPQATQGPRAGLAGRDSAASAAALGADPGRQPVEDVAGSSWCLDHQLLAVGDIDQTGRWLQTLDELPDSPHYLDTPGGLLYITTWETPPAEPEDQAQRFRVDDSESLVRASLAVVEDHPIPVVGAVMCCDGGYEWVPAGGAKSFSSPAAPCGGLRDDPGTGPFAKVVASTDRQSSPVVLPRDWWRASQRVSQPHRRWVVEVWDLWKDLLFVADDRDCAGEPPLPGRTGRLFESWDSDGQVVAVRQPSPADTAMMLAGLHDPALRDGVLLAGAVRGDAAWFAFLDDLVVSGSVDQLATHLSEIFRGSQAPSWRHMEQSRESVVNLCADAPDRFAARGLAMVSWWFWFAGRMGLARQWAGRANQADHTVRLAQLVAQACAAQVVPGWMRHGYAAS